jgi:hypothetical protein
MSRPVSKAGQKKERAGYGVCQEDYEIVRDETGETAQNPEPQGNSV